MDVRLFDTSNESNILDDDILPPLTQVPALADFSYQPEHPLAARIGDCFTTRPIIPAQSQMNAADSARSGPGLFYMSDSSPRRRRKKRRKAYIMVNPRRLWSPEEHRKFVIAIEKHQRNWTKIKDFVGTKTAVQIRSHAQKYFKKLEERGDTHKIPPKRSKKTKKHTMSKSHPQSAIALQVYPPPHQSSASHANTTTARCIPGSMPVYPMVATAACAPAAPVDLGGPTSGGGPPEQWAVLAAQALLMEPGNDPSNPVMAEAAPNPLISTLYQAHLGDVAQSAAAASFDMFAPSAMDAEDLPPVPSLKSLDIGPPESLDIGPPPPIFSSGRARRGSIFSIHTADRRENGGQRG
eukprot:3968_1